MIRLELVCTNVSHHQDGEAMGPAIVTAEKFSAVIFGVLWVTREARAMGWTELRGGRWLCPQCSELEIYQHPKGQPPSPTTRGRSR